MVLAEPVGSLRSSQARAERSDRLGPVRLWLAVVCALIVAMVLVGGATRLTDSGLSITEWQPILGAIPPLSEAEWLVALEKYRQIPEYQQINRGMSLAEFQFIYWWEWAHRFLGRIIGVVFFVPLLVFWVQGRLTGRLKWQLSGIFLLGGLQGFMGWYMVQSGLTERTDVSQIRLMMHLGLALIILSACFWVLMNMRQAKAEPRPGQGLAVILSGLVLLQILLGALVAGLDAGMTYNTWPLMDGSLVPSGLLFMDPWYVNFWDNITTVQFQHRMGGYLVAIVAVIVAWAAWRAGAARLAALLVAAVFAQIALGVWTVLGVVPLGPALAHQAGGVVLLLLSLAMAHRSPHAR